METNCDWILVDSSKYDRQFSLNKADGHLKFLLSPYDVPEAVRGTFDAAREVFVVEFRYLGGSLEPKIEKRYRGVHLAIGRNSRRLYSVSIDRDQLGHDCAAGNTGSSEILHAVLPQIAEAIKQLSSELTNDHVFQVDGDFNPRLENYDVVKEVIKDSALQIVSHPVS